MNFPNSVKEGDTRFSCLTSTHSGAGAFELEAKFQADADPRKVNLIIGAYRSDSAEPWQKLNIQSLHHEYLPLRGNQKLIEAARLLIFGRKFIQEAGRSIASIQTVAGTGANSLIAMLLEKHVQPARIWLPNPTWANHRDIWTTNAPGISLRWFPYYNDSTQSFDFEAMMATLKQNARDNDAVLLHVCAHNPTGSDPTEREWMEIAQLCDEKNLFVIFDSAYQGLASGNPELDAWPVRHFCSHSAVEFAVCQSFSKNFGLYGERTGVLHVVVSRAASQGHAKLVEERLVELQRALISMPPLLGSLIATEILTDENLMETWKKDLELMTRRMNAMRRSLYDELLRLQTPGNWEHIIKQTGMFSYTGLDKDDIALLQRDYHIYMLPSGRASICGIASENVTYIAQAINRKQPFVHQRGTCTCARIKNFKLPIVSCRVIFHDRTSTEFLRDSDLVHQCSQLPQMLVVVFLPSVNIKPLIHVDRYQHCCLPSVAIASGNLASACRVSDACLNRHRYKIPTTVNR
ncbi:aspartate transaminase [Purpureocillium lilacinum]|uniref:Aspartate transaminase n=1 Tax=Purpureocillium lilacinum TaxID=33203 RepID=A0A179F1G0_PURLI|nr:aspartate transaminase [Purpureocillium lilacinum]